MKKTNTHQMVKIAFLSAIAVVLFMFEFPLPGLPLQFDLSDLPVMMGAVLFGPGSAIMIALLKNIMHMLFLSKNAGIIGEVANFAYALAISLPLSVLIYRKHLTKPKLILTGFITVVGAALFMHVFNYYVTFPLYGLSQDGAWQILNAVYLPFNLIKGTILFGLLVLIKPVLNRFK